MDKRDFRQFFGRLVTLLGRCDRVEDRSSRAQFSNRPHAHQGSTHDGKLAPTGIIQIQVLGCAASPVANSSPIKCPALGKSALDGSQPWKQALTVVVPSSNLTLCQAPTPISVVGALTSWARWTTGSALRTSTGNARRTSGCA